MILHNNAILYAIYKNNIIIKIFLNQKQKFIIKDILYFQQTISLLYYKLIEKLNEKGN